MGGDKFVVVEKKTKLNLFPTTPTTPKVLGAGVQCTESAPIVFPSTFSSFSFFFLSPSPGSDNSISRGSREKENEKNCLPVYLSLSLSVCAALSGEHSLSLCFTRYAFEPITAAAAKSAAGKVWCNSSSSSSRIPSFPFSPGFFYRGHIWGWWWY